ncbi:hypothetical protein HDU67_009074 [Dinochytrium kinnereticum]|nr:hypothetical protein HDU67_009074 [Dinochytrium kinnereticum]
MPAQIKGTLFQAYLASARIFAFCDPTSAINSYLGALECRYLDAAPPSTLSNLVKATAQVLQTEPLFSMHKDTVEQHIFPSSKKPPSDKKSSFESLALEAARYSSRAALLHELPHFNLAATSLYLLSASAALIAGRITDAVDNLISLSKFLLDTGSPWKASDVLDLASNILRNDGEAASDAFLLLLDAALLTVELDDRVRSRRFEVKLLSYIEADVMSIPEVTREMGTLVVDLLQVSASLDLHRLDADLELRVDMLEDGRSLMGAGQAALLDVLRQRLGVMTSTLSLSILVAALTAFQFGYHSGVINQPRDAISNCTSGTSTPGSLPDCIPMDDWQWGIFVSLFLLGGIVGGLSGGHFATVYGRRRVIMIDNFAFVASGLLLGFSPNVMQLYLGRFIAGVGAGVGTVVVPLYIAEVSPMDLRGAYGSLNQLSIVVGVLLSQVAGVALSTRDGWRPLLALTVAVFKLQSPKRWLAARGLVHDTRKSLTAVRGPAYDIEAELAEMLGASESGNADDNGETGTRSQIQADSSTTQLIQDRPPRSSSNQNKPLTVSELLERKALRRPLIAAFALQLIQQFSGINAAVYYSTTIFTQSYPAETAIKLTLLVSVVNLVMTLVSSSLIEKLGRRTLLLTAELGMAVSAFIVVLSVHFDLGASVIVAALMTFVGAFGLGLGAIPWLILPELVPSYALGPAASICTGINWTASFTLALLFPILIRSLGYDVFFLFGIVLLGAAAFTKSFVPETKGLKPEEVAVVNHYN